MAEHFYGRQHTVHFSNGGAEQLLRAWLRLSVRIPVTSDLQVVRDFLQVRLDRYYDGGRSFAIDPPPAELATPGRLTCLSQLILLFAQELQEESPDSSLTDLVWDRELRLHWIAKLRELYFLVADAITPLGGNLPPFDLTLPSEDKIIVDLNSLMNRYAELYRRAQGGQASLTDEMHLSKIEQIENLVLLANTLSTQRMLLLNYRFIKALCYLDLGDKERALETFESTLSLEDDDKLREGTIELFIEPLKEELHPE